uniref:CDP-alcohol phosphatidyltransferase n=1 Tax=viral metagenome TaxID=1070528 RepID=A0A6C0EL69_9ZZZZ
MTKDECPVDNFLNDIADWLSPLFKKMYFTPNGITTLSLIFGLLSAWFLWKGKVWLFAILYMISFFFDCMDGLYARKYKMTSKFGDWYDHIKDWVVGLILVVIIFMRYKDRCSPSVLIIVAVVFLLLTVLMGIFVGCQDKKRSKGASLTLFQKMCVGDVDKNIRWMRYFGPGTWTIFFILTVILMEKKICT